MTREQAIKEIKIRIKCERYLNKSKSGLYVCPYCDSGSGPHGTGALKVYDTNTWTCHACNESGDVIDLFQMQTGADFNTAVSTLADELGITIDNYSLTVKSSPVNRPQSDPSEPGNTNTHGQAKTAENAIEPDYTAYYRECCGRLSDPAAAAYLQGRGISLDTAAAYLIGYDPAADPAGAPGAMGTETKRHPAPRIIIPTTPAHYVGRRIDGEKEFAKINSKGSTPGIFNSKALFAQDAQEIFVVEGAFDALSILEAGFNAIALNSAGNVDALISLLEQNKTGATLILCPDSDADPRTAERVQKEFAKLSEGLQRLNVPHMIAEINGEYKDANEHLTGNRDAFTLALAQTCSRASRPDNTNYYIEALMSADIERFKQDKKTGFSNLDEKAGGLYSGLYVLAAISSLGKTSFALQLADQLTERGNDVVFFSLEQSRLELISKSLARRTVTKTAAGEPVFDNAVTSLAIRKGYKPVTVARAAQEYKDATAGRMSIVEGNFACNVNYICDYVRQYVQRTNIRPVVFVDYLQILQPAENTRRQSTKEVIDNTVTELKRISRDLDLTLIVISSVNRANYMVPFDFESLKESGGIEFTADVVWGLQLQCINEDIFVKEGRIKEKREMIKKAKAATPRKIELSCLKNRYGIANYSCYFNYYPANDLFTEDSDPDEYKVEWRHVPRI